MKEEKGKIKFEGEYLNYKKWNGKGYDYNGKCVYEIKDGKGYVKEYDNGKLSFEGEYLNGLENGKVKKYYNGVLTIEGEYINWANKKRKNISFRR